MTKKNDEIPYIKISLIFNKGLCKYIKLQTRKNIKKYIKIRIQNYFKVKITSKKTLSQKKMFIRILSLGLAAAILVESSLELSGLV